MKRVLVMIDQARLQGVSVGQFADYVALVGLAQIKADGPVGEAPTILRLFDSPSHTPPDAMSEWDRALPRSLYATTESTLKGQRGQRDQIDHQIVTTIAP